MAGVSVAGNNVRGTPLTLAHPPAPSSKFTLDRHGRVVGVTYLGSEPVEAANLERVVGLHESALGSLRMAHDTGKVSSFVECVARERRPGSQRAEVAVGAPAAVQRAPPPVGRLARLPYPSRSG